MVHVLEGIGIPALGAFVGLVIGFVVGAREGGDYNLAPAIYAPVGAVAGGAIGVVIAAIVTR